jgi:hypothetical protein
MPELWGDVFDRWKSSQLSTENKPYALAICQGCGGSSFHIYISEGPSVSFKCDNCEVAWETNLQVSGNVAGSDKALGEGRDEPSNLVSKEKEFKPHEEYRAIVERVRKRSE